MPTQVRSEQASAMGGCATCSPAGATPPAASPQSASAQYASAQYASAGSTRASSPPPKSVVVVDASKDTWIGIELVDANKRPVAHAAYIVTPANQGAIHGTLDANGKARIEGVDPGNCTVEFPDHDKREFA